MKTQFVSMPIILILSIVILVGCKEKTDDITAPVLTLKAPNPLYLATDSLYNEPGFIAIDETDGDLTNKVTISGTINSSIEGDYTLYYNVSDKAGNKAIQKTRTIRVMTF